MAAKHRGSHRGMRSSHSHKRVSVKSKGGKSKIRKVMREYKHGKLHIGKSKHLVHSRDQAIAIAISEAKRRGKKKH